MSKETVRNAIIQAIKNNPDPKISGDVLQGHLLALLDLIPDEGGDTNGAVVYNMVQALTAVQMARARANIGSARAVGEEPGLKVADLIGSNDTVTVKEKFLIRTTAGVASIDSEKDALLLEITGGHGFKINALRWNGDNALNPTAWAQGDTSGYIIGAVASGAIAKGSNKLAIIRCPECKVGEYGTAAENNGYLITDVNNVNRYVGDGTVLGVWYSPTLPASGSEVTAVTEHVFSGHTEKFYVPNGGYLVVEFALDADLEDYDVHLAWSKEYDVFKAYTAPVELSLIVNQLTSVFDTETVNGKVCLVLRGGEHVGKGVYDRIVINQEGGGTAERNLAGLSLITLTWTETPITQESIEGEEPTVSGYRYTASLPTTGTYAAMRDGYIDSDVEGMVLQGFTLVYESPTQINVATEFAGKTVDYQIAIPVTGTHSINPNGKKPNDMGTEEVVGGDVATGTIVIEYKRGFYDTVRALLSSFAKVVEQLEENEYTKPNYCVGAWLKNANIASPTEQENPKALGVFGNKAWALDWRPGLVDMTSVEGETFKEAKELRRNNWFRDIFGNWSPAVGITQAMYDECMANALYTDPECTVQYCAAGAYNPETFLALCSIVTVDGVKKLSHPTLYKEANTEVAHYLMPWETTETKYSIFVGRKDTVHTLDNVVGSSGKEWNGILGVNLPVWDGVDLEAYALKPTGICPSPVTTIVEDQVAKLRSFFFNYNATDSYSKGNAGASGCTMFRNNGHYRTNQISQIGTATRARANNHVATAPFPVAEGGYHARNTFLRCIETALGTKMLCNASRFSSGVSSVDACGNETQWLANGGLRYKAQGAESWSYCKLDGNPAMYYGSGETKSTTNASSWLSSYGPLSKTMEAQMAVSFAVEFGIAAGERFEFNGCTWWYENPTNSSFNPPTVADGYMNARVFKIVTGTFTGYASANATETTTFDLEVCVRTGLMLGCDMSGDGGPYWGGGCEIVGECVTAPGSGSYGHRLKAYIEPDQEKWVLESAVNVNIGTKFASGFEDKYRLAGSIVTRSSNYTRRRLANTPLPASMGGNYSKGECGYSYMANYWGTAGKKTRVGVRFGNYAYNGYLSARPLYARYSAGSTFNYCCGSAQVLWRMQ